MKYSRIVLSVLLFSAIHAVSAKSQNEVYIESASQFQKWCKYQSYRHFRRKKLQPYNWSASTYRKLNDYQTLGSWKVRGKARDVLCHIRVGEKAKHTIMEIQ
ncbi:MAG: hypothetical protein OEY78_09065 [Gammaproteobacteria bacterium]|nr:hypothetical protein [Gammaproteobacteria bacterium]